MPEKLLDTHVFFFNPRDNGGEQLSLTTEIYDNGDAAAGLAGGIFINQELVLQSYGNSASFFLCGTPMTPELLRKCADRLEEAMEMARSSIQPKAA